MRTFLASIYCTIAFCSVSVGQSDDTGQYFEAQRSSDVYELLQRYGYVIEQDVVLWLISPDGTRVQLYTFGDQSSISGFRLSAWFSIRNSSAAAESALYYEQTNPLASVAFDFRGDVNFVYLQRDVQFGPGRTEENIIANVQLLFGLIPHFEASLAESDPELAAFWYSIEESGQ